MFKNSKINELMLGISHKTCLENHFWWIGNLSGQTWSWFSEVIFFNSNSISLIKCDLIMSIQSSTYTVRVAGRADDGHVKNSWYTCSFFLPIPLNEVQLTKEKFGLLEKISVTTEVKDYCLWKVWLRECYWTCVYLYLKQTL